MGLGYLGYKLGLGYLGCKLGLGCLGYKLGLGHLGYKLGLGHLGYKLGLALIQMGFAQTATVPRRLAMKYLKRGGPNFSPRPEGSNRNVGDDKGVFIANFFIASRRCKTSFVSILHPFRPQAGTFLDLLGGLGAQVDPSTDFRTILG